MLLAVDAGGTCTRAALVTEAGQVVGAGKAGPANWSTLGEEAATRAIEAAVRLASEDAAVDAAPDGACVALAGYYPPWHASAVTRALAPFCGAALRVETDLRAAWAGATGLQPGVVVVSGTGSVAYGEDDQGRSARSGGWGPLAGDEGSAPSIGAAALRAIGRMLDGRGPATLLADLFLKSRSASGSGMVRELGNRPQNGPPSPPIMGGAGTESTEAPPIIGGLGGLSHVRRPYHVGEGEGEAANDRELLEHALRSVYREGWGRREIGSVAPLVSTAAAAGDAVALAILQGAAASLGELAHAVLRALGLSSSGARVSLTGGVVRAGALVLDPFRRWLEITAPGVVLVPPRLTPLGGAALLALRTVGSWQLALNSGAGGEEWRDECDRFIDALGRQLGDDQVTS